MINQRRAIHHADSSPRRGCGGRRDDTARRKDTTVLRVSSLHFQEPTTVACRHRTYTFPAGTYIQPAPTVRRFFSSRSTSTTRASRPICALIGHVHRMHHKRALVWRKNAESEGTANEPREGPMNFSAEQPSLRFDALVLRRPFFLPSLFVKRSHQQVYQPSNLPTPPHPVHAIHFLAVREYVMACADDVAW